VAGGAAAAHPRHRRGFYITEGNMTPPKFLYKYQAFDDHSLDNLAKSHIWFSKPIHLNDPYDCAVRPPIRPASDADWTQVYMELRSSVKTVSPADADRAYWTNGRPNAQFKDMFLSDWGKNFGAEQDHFRNNHGVACFSEENDNLLMWSHYGCKHTGFCIEFDISCEPFRSAFKVSYSKDIPSANPVDLYLGPDGLGKLMVGTKAYCWAYENEWRILNTEGDAAVKLDPRCITGVYLGLRTKPDDRARAMEVFRGTSVKFYYMVKNETMFMLEARPASMPR
jgi:hypothetical protein